MKFKSFFWAILAIVIVALVLLVPFFIKIEKINCLNQFGNCSDAFVSQLKKIQGKSLKNAEKDIEKLKSNTVSVKKAVVSFVFPNTLNVEIYERLPKFAIRKEKFFLVSSDGFVLGQSDETALPYIVGIPGEISVGERVNDEVFFALSLVSEVFSLYQVRSGQWQNDKLTIELPLHLTVIFPLRGDRKLLVGKLNLITSRLKSDEGNMLNDKAVSEIDLRFANPVLR